MAAGESGEFFSVREGIAADDRPVGGDGLQTFGGVRALARYVKIVAVPASGGSIGINEASLGGRGLTDCCAPNIRARARAWGGFVLNRGGNKKKTGPHFMRCSRSFGRQLWAGTY